jgi:hypothetical protein
MISSPVAENATRDESGLNVSDVIVDEWTFRDVKTRPEDVSAI